MAAKLQLDHLVIAVNDLQQASEGYRLLGFNVVTGGRHQHAPTQNSLVYFADGTYLELIEWTAPAPGETWYERLSRHGEGLIDMAFVPSDMAAALQQARAGGAAYDGPIDGSRLKPTGEQVKWQLAWPQSANLPFLCADVTPRALRVPEGEVREQPNRIGGITSIAIRVADVDQAARGYSALLGVDLAHGASELSEVDELHIRSFKLGSVVLYLVAPSSHGSSSLATRLRDDLAQKGEGIYRVCLNGVGASWSAQDVPAFGHGISPDLSDETSSLAGRLTPN